MRRQLPDPRAIYDSRRRATADPHKRSALNAHLPDAGEALSRMGNNVDPVAGGPRMPQVHFVAESMIALIGVEALKEHAGSLIDRLNALEASDSPNEYFGPRRAVALDLWDKFSSKADAAPEDFDALLGAILMGAWAWLPRDPDKAATPPAEES